MTVATALLMLAQAGFAEPQAHEIARYFARATNGPGAVAAETILDPCANSRLGEGLVDVTGTLRGELRRFATGFGMQSRAPAHPSVSCVPAEVQIAFLAYAFPLHYPECAARFEAGDLSAFQRCWGEGRGR